MITTADLETQTRRDLAGTARDIGISGWHSMKKDELIAAIRKAQEAERPKDSPKRSASAKQPTKAATKRSDAAAEVPAEASQPVKRRRPVASKQPAPKELATKQDSGKQVTIKQAATKQATKATASNLSSPKTHKSDSKVAAKAVDAKDTNAKSIDAKADPKASTVSPKNASLTSAKPASAKNPAKAKGKSESSKSSGKGKRASAPPRQPTSPEILKVLRKQQASAESRKDLSACVMVNGSAGGDPTKPSLKERIVLIVRDSYWLQASWIIARSSVERARAAMGADWHTAEPVLRLLEVAHGASANTAEKTVRDIPIHGGVNNRYIDVENPPARYRVVIGYRAATNRFFTLFRSNIVLTPEPGACDPIDGHWQDIAEDYERIYSLSDNDSGTGSNDLREMFEERLQRPMVDLNSEPASLDPDLSFRREKDLPFEVDAELIVYGSTAPGASVTLSGSPVRLRPDGTFTVRMELPDRRQVIPVVACSRDGMRQRTTVVAVERNTKVMEPVLRHQMD